VTPRVFGAAHKDENFTVTERHLKLLRASRIAWSSQWDGTLYGAACVDPRRPYGSADVVRSMIRVLEWKMPNVKGHPWDPETDDIPDNIYNTLEELHAQTEIVLRIAMDTGKFEAGHYYFPAKEGDPWRKVGEKG
jgi:hypothetical protein